MVTCTNVECDAEATATVLVGNVRMPKCFEHEREYADRYGPADVYPLYTCPDCGKEIVD